MGQQNNPGTSGKSLTYNIAEYYETRIPENRTTLCFAPFISMNFDQSGKATACCFNRSSVFGTYPEKTIQEIWNSDTRVVLMDAMKNLDLSKGCNLCELQLRNREYHSVLAKNFEERGPVLNFDAVDALPRVLEFEISNVCNLECVMCSGYFSSSIRKNREKLPPVKSPYDTNFVEQLRPYWKSVVRAKFLGGEPFLNQLYFKMWADIFEINPKVSCVITSNGTILNKKVEKVLNELRPDLVLSIDSLRKKTYESIRIKSDFEKLMFNLAAFLEFHRRPGNNINLAVCPMVQNWDEIPDIFNWGLHNLVQIGLNTVVNPIEFSLRSLPAKKLREIIKYYKSTPLKTAEAFNHKDKIKAKITEEYNQVRYEGLINQVEAWLSEKVN
jgi:MoaA/NifB/PqqE/SkfB family radical SAM enzyme